MSIQSIIKGAIKVQGVPESACFQNFAQLLNALGTYLSVEIANQAFSNVVISVAQPGQADRDKMWVRLNPAGQFIGFYFYFNNIWNQVYPVPGEIFWLIGDSANPPAGFAFFDNSDGTMTGPDYTELIAMAVPNGGTPPFVYYPARYIAAL